MPERHGPVRVADLLGDAARRFGVDDPAAVRALWTSWREVVGDDIAAHAEPTSLRDGVLRVRADSPAWASEITYLATQIVGSLQGALGASAVRDLRVWVGPGRPAGRRVPEPAPARAESVHEEPGPPPEDPVEAFERARRAWARRRFPRRR